jgi:hypothetical protein
MRHRASPLTAGLVGIALAGLIIVVTGWLAALPISGPLFRGFGPHSTAIFVLSSVVMIDLPVMAVSFAVGVVLFRALRRATPVLVMICAAPWVLAVGFDLLRALLNWPNETKLSLTFSLVSWSTLVTIPAGLFLASLLRGGWPSNNRLGGIDISHRNKQHKLIEN